MQRRNLNASILLMALMSTYCVAQEPTLERLRAQLNSGDATGVVDHVRRSIGARTVSVDELLIGTEAAITAARFVDARGMSDMAIAAAPTDPRTHTLSGHTLFAMAEDAGSKARGGGSFIRATYADAALAYGNARAHGGAAYDLLCWESDARFRAEEFESALKLLLKADEQQPGTLAVDKLRGEVLLAQGQFAAALSALDGARGRHPGSEEIALMSLRAALGTGSRDGAVQVLLQVVPHLPERPEIFRVFIGAFEAERPDTFLVQTLEKVRAVVPPDRDAVFLWFSAAVDEAALRNEAALRGFEAYLGRRPNAPEGEFKRGSVLIALGRLGEAKECLLKAHAAGSLDETALVAALRGLVGAHVAKRQFAEALSTQELALALSSNDLDALNLGVLQLQAGEPELALATYRGLVAREDLDLASHARAWNYLGLALRGQGDLSAAEAAFRESLRILESGGDARENLAALLLAKGDEADALREGKAVLAEAPSRARAAYLCMLAQHRWLARGGR